MDAYSAGVGAFPLILAAAGERVRVVAVGGGRGIDRKLSDLGLTTGCEVTVVSRDGSGPMVVARDDMSETIDKTIPKAGAWIPGLSVETSCAAFPND